MFKISGSKQMSYENSQKINAMEQISSRDARNHSACQKIPSTLREPERLLPCPQEPATSPCPGPDASIPQEYICKTPVLLNIAINISM
jgi:hypothetical protein